MTVRLQPGDLFPTIEVNLPERTLRVPADLAGGYAVVLFYRGSWCPYCNAQLATFQRALPQLQEADVQVVALSVDDADTTATLVAKRRLTFPVGHGAQARAIAAATGAFVNEDPLYLQSTGFVLNQEGRVVVSVYSSGAIGRLVPEDVLGLLRHLRKHPLPEIPCPFGRDHAHVTARPLHSHRRPRSPVGVVAAPAALSDTGRRGSDVVLVQIDALTGNSVAAFDRGEDAALHQAGAYNTGGLGGALTGASSTTPPPRALTADRDNRELYAVKAESNTLSVFTVGGDRLQLRQVVHSAARALPPDPVAAAEQRLDPTRGAGTTNSNQTSLSRPRAPGFDTLPAQGQGRHGRDEVELLDRLRAGDEAAFARLVDRYHAAMLRVARTHVRSQAVAEEFVQDAWLGLVWGLNAFEGRSSLRTWLFRIVVNRAISTGLHERRHVPVGDDQLEHESGRFSQDGWWVVPPAHWADEAVERLSAPEVAARIHELIDDLPVAQRQVVTLQDVEGLSSVEVCDVLGITDGNRRVLLHRARARIREHLEREAYL